MPLMAAATSARGQLFACDRISSDMGSTCGSCKFFVGVDLLPVFGVWPVWQRSWQDRDVHSGTQPVLSQGLLDAPKWKVINSMNVFIKSSFNLIW